MKSIILAISLGLIFSTQAEQVVIVKAVSSSGKTFAVSIGSEQGITQGQESLFTNTEASFKAQNTAVDRNYSLWQITSKQGQVPFQKGEFISFTSSLENVWNQIARSAKIEKSELGFKPHDLWIFRTHYSYALSESISGTDSEQYAGRSGLQIEALYGRRFDVKWEVAAGLRYDRETSTLQNPALNIPTQRMMLAAEGTYHFYQFDNSDNSLYLSIGFAYGISNTNIGETTSSGIAMALPVVKLGYTFRKNEKYTWVFEGSFESINTEESFADNSKQVTNLTNSKFGVGLRF